MEREGRGVEGGREAPLSEEGAEGGGEGQPQELRMDVRSTQDKGWGARRQGLWGSVQLRIVKGREPQARPAGGGLRRDVNSQRWPWKARE